MDVEPPSDLLFLYCTTFGWSQTKRLYEQITEIKICEEKVKEYSHLGLLKDFGWSGKVI